MNSIHTLQNWIESFTSQAMGDFLRSVCPVFSPVTNIVLDAFLLPVLADRNVLVDQIKDRPHSKLGIDPQLIGYPF